MSAIVKVLQAGKMSYIPALKLQQLLADRHKLSKEAAGIQDTLILVEHFPVYTVGIRSKDYSQETEDKLVSLGADFHRTNRGGLITFHGPGQLVVYPILNLRNYKPSIRWYVHQIERTIIDVCNEMGIEAETSPHTGVWVGDRKICAIGIHGSRFITTHGLALNCNINLEWFSHIVPCGIEGKEVTSLSREMRRECTIEEVVPVFLNSFSKLFGCILCNFPKEDADQIFKYIRKDDRTLN
jgi:lipoyl(octanoyl) transferase